MLDFNDSIDIWNTVIHLRTPAVQDVCNRFGCELISVFEHAPWICYLRSNIAVNLVPGESLGPTAKIQSMLLVTRRGFFVGPTSVVTIDTPRFKVVDMIMPDTATRALSHLTAKDGRHVKTATSPNRWEIFYGDALGFMFNGSDANETDVNNVTLAYVKYHLNMEFSGLLTPEINSVNSRDTILNYI